MNGPEEFFDKLREFLERGQDDPRSENPNDYPRSIKVEDYDIGLCLEELRSARMDCNRLEGKMRAAWHQAEATKARFFSMLEEKYPQIRTYDCGGTKWCSWRGDLYYVSWDPPTKDKAPTTT